MAETDSLYLQRLKFDSKLNNSPIKVLFQNPRLIILMIFALLTFGLFAFTQLPRETTPEVKIPIINVVTVLPGASPRDVERLVTEKIEGIAAELSSLDTYSSTSRSGVSVVTFTFLSNLDPDQALRQTKEEVDSIANELPDDANDPEVSKLDFNDQAVLSFIITGPMDRLTLSNIARELKDELEIANGVKEVGLTGAEEEEVVVALNQAALKEYNLSAQTITQALQANNITLPAGDIRVGDLEYSLSLENDLNSLAKIRSLPISTGRGGQTIQLGQVADVFLRTKENNILTSFVDVHGQQTAVQLEVFKAEGSKINQAVSGAQVILDRELLKYPTLRVENVTDAAADTSKTLDDLVGNFSSSILLIFIVLAVFLGLRQAATAALTIPLTMLAAIILMLALGQTINFLSLFSLLLALSLIGDDAIVMSQATTFYGKKFGPLETGLLVFKDFFIPIWVGTLTVVWSFVPLFFTSGIIGQFIRPIPVVVTSTLLASTAIATFINLPLNIILRDLQLPRRMQLLLTLLGAAMTIGLVWALAGQSTIAGLVLGSYVVLLILFFLTRKQLLSWGNEKLRPRIQSIPFFSRIRSTQNDAPNRDFFNNSLISMDPLVRVYRRVVTSLSESRARRFIVYAVCGGLVLLSVVFIATGLLKNEFFPASDTPYIYINVEGPAGWTRTKTEEVLTKVAVDVSTQAGARATFITTGSNFSGDGGGINGQNVGYVTLLLKDKAERDQSSMEISEQLRQQLAAVTEVKVQVAEISDGGPPAGATFQVNIKGTDLTVLEKISNEYQTIIKEIPGTINISSSLQLSSGQITVDLNEQKLAERGLTAAQVGGWLRTALSGSEAAETIIDTEDRDITLYLQQPLQTISSLQNLTLPSALGSYSLSEVAVLRLQNSPTSIQREDGQRVVRVTSDAGDTTGPEILKAFQVKMNSYEMLSGYTWDVGGSNEENNDSVASIISAMGISFFLILVTMVLQLRSFRKAILVMLVIPLAMAGVFINFTIFGIPLSFPALIGVLALFGIVVNNGIMLLEKINLNLENGFDLYDAVVDASSSRVEAIFLSNFTAIVGLLPITIADPLWRGLGGSIIAGLSVSGFLILFFLPSLYIEIFASKTAKKQHERPRLNHRV